MPLTIRPAPYSRLCRALATYQRELDEILEPIQAEAQRVGTRPDPHFPPDVLHETALTAECAHLVKASQSGTLQYFGVGFTDAQSALLRSALVLLRDDLADRAQAILADPLSGSAAGPVFDEIAKVERDIDTVGHQYGYSPLLSQLQRRRAIKRGLAIAVEISIDSALEVGEGQAIEFIQQYPSSAHDLAKEIAAFATSNAGTIFLGISDAGRVLGLQDADNLTARDAFRRRIEVLSTGAIKPSVVPRRVGPPAGPTVGGVAS